jgi:hypothetical protein
MYKAIKDINPDRMIRSVCEIAKAGLGRYYAAGGGLPYTAVVETPDQFDLSGFSLRYAAIGQIGVAKWCKSHPEDACSLPDLWTRIINNKNKAIHIGDYALGLWAGILSEADDSAAFAKLLSDGWANAADSCDAVELGWIVQACTLAVRNRSELESISKPILDEAKARLIRLFVPGSDLFQKHDRPGACRAVSRRVACFADQVYPIVALSNYGAAFDDRQCVECAANATDQICRLQGPLGQWWWHYDARNGKICEEYPVFSVHQDAMAPMAILASDRAAGADHMQEIELGLRWLFGENELNSSMLLEEAGIIWRDIEKREPGKLSRNLRAILCTAGLGPLHRFAGKCCMGFRMNRECRPYHLGWILYAWADFDKRKEPASEV